MQPTLRKSLESDSAIFDIVLYGSRERGAPDARDEDILVIFTTGSLKERLIKLQAIKTTLQGDKVDIKQVLLTELFDPHFLARTGVLSEGSSVMTGKPFAQRLGFEPYSLFCYSLSTMPHREKVSFNYLLAGRTTEGILKQLQAIRLVPGVIRVPIKNSYTFEQILKQNRVAYRKTTILEPIGAIRP